MSSTPDTLRRPSADEGQRDSGDAGYAKRLKNRHIQMIGIGGAIGSGLFLGSAGRLREAGPSLIFSYATCGVIAMIVVRALGEMVLHRPSSGAFVSYSREFIGEKGAYAAGWFHFINWSFTLIADATAIATFLYFWHPISDNMPKWALALIALAVVLAINLIGVKLFGEVEFWFSIIKVAMLVIFMIVAIYFIATSSKLGANTAGIHNITDHGGIFPNGPSHMWTLMSGVIFAYAAMELIGVAAGETESPREVMPKAIRSVLWRILIFYVGTMTLLSIVLPYTTYQKDTSPFVTVFDRLGFHIGAVKMADIMSIVLVTAVASSMNSGLYSTGRVLRSMAHAGTAPKFLGKMSRHQVPWAAICATAAFGLIGVILNLVVPEDAFEIVLEVATLGIIGVWSMILISHIMMVRKAGRGEMERPDFRLKGAPALNYLALAFLAFIVVLMATQGGVLQKTILIMGPVVTVCMIGGWFLVRKNINAEAFDDEDGAIV